MSMYKKSKPSPIPAKILVKGVQEASISWERSNVFANSKEMIPLGAMVFFKGLLRYSITIDAMKKRYAIENVNLFSVVFDILLKGVLNIFESIFVFC